MTGFPLGQWLAVAALAAGLLACGPTGSELEEKPERTAEMSLATPVRLEPGLPKRRLAEGETHPYLLSLETGEYVRIVADQYGVDLVLKLFAPGGTQPLVEKDSPTGTRGAERISVIAAVTGDYRVEVVGGEGTAAGDYEIRVAERRVATPADHKRVDGERIFLEGERLRRAKSFEEAIARYERALGLYREAEDLTGQAAALYSIGWMRERLDRWEEAARLCREAAELYRQAGEPTGRAQALNRSGRLLHSLRRPEEALPLLEEAIRLFRATSDAEGEAAALINLGGAYVQADRFRDAVEAYDQALPLSRKAGDRHGEAVARLTLGLLYLEHGKWAEARNEYEEALQTADAIGERDLAASALDGLGLVDYREGRFAESRARSEQALALYRELKDRRGQARALTSLGSALLGTGQTGEARSRYEEARALFHALEDPQGEATATSHLGRVALAEGEPRRALELHREALARFQQIEDRQGLSRTHYGMAQALLALSDPDGALREIETSLELAERQRSATESLDVRAFYFATRQHYWELYIDVLLALDRLRPNQGFAARALEAEERRRARSLLDALAEIRAGTRQGEARLQDTSPLQARKEDGQTLSLVEIRKRLLDTDTLLLIYSLGEERSILWKVTRSTLVSHSLPPREKIEASALRVHKDLSSRLPESQRQQIALDHLSDLVLKPVAADLPKYRRLLIVADGALHLVPFAALPDPGAAPVEGRAPRVIEGHPVIHLPSASVGATLRQERRGTPLNRQGPLVAIVADPVFDTAPPSPGEDSRADLARSVRDLGLARLEPLPYTREEAEAIHALRPGAVVSVLGFEAKREILEDERWRHAPILHFATHGLFNDRQPELSGLAFTQVNPDGTPRRNSFLRLQDIYGLDLDADMVVLSACQTGLGKELRGEGLLGMTRGFLTRGVPQLVVSLWKVGDRSTKELMTRFYRELFNGYPPPEALQRAQKTMLREPAWNDPAQWAGFIFVGDFERRPGGDIEARDTGGTTPVQKADGAGLPIKPKPKKPSKPPGPGGSPQ